MDKRNYKLTIGSKTIEGKWALILGILILIPILCLVGLILSLVFSLVGMIIGGTFSIVGGVLSLVGIILKFVLVIIKFALYIVLGAIGLALIMGILALFLPKSWRDKLGVHSSFTYKRSSSHQDQKPDTTPDGNPIIDVDYKEEKEENK